ncbi:hypothetical protein MIC448_2380012 [Microbacterium sp. C448]|nr:hypothetical protein [Microbacterium sp. C448]CDK00337.1 hypothetical protein MIC448_2380012 [Microbacterium sp. C448]
MASSAPAEILDIDGHEVRVSNPSKVVFPEPGLTKLDIVRYYLAVADGALRGAGGRPMVLKRFVKGIGAEAFFQKRVPENHPDFIDTATLRYASGTSAEEAVVRDAAGLAWIANLGCLDLNPHPVRAEDLEHPDELRIDLDPMPGVAWEQIVDVAMIAGEVLADHGLVGWPKTSGSRGLHILVRIEPRWTFRELRAAAEALAREVEARAPGLATARWWKEALEALERWRAEHPAAAAALHPADELIDGMRGSSSLWYRVRVNLQHVPEEERPEQGPLLGDYDPWAGRAFPGR